MADVLAEVVLGRRADVDDGGPRVQGLVALGGIPRELLVESQLADLYQALLLFFVEVSGRIRKSASIASAILIIPILIVHLQIISRRRPSEITSHLNIYTICKVTIFKK